MHNRGRLSRIQRGNGFIKMQIEIEGKSYLVITRADGSIQTIEINPANAEYMALMNEETANE